MLKGYFVYLCLKCIDLKPSLELLKLTNAQKSFNFFQEKVDCFVPYWHYHPELELTLITKGQGTRFVGNSILPFYDYDLVLVGENLPHHWVSSKNEEIVEQQAFVFQFPKNIFKSLNECNKLETLFKASECGIQFTNPSPEIIKAIMSFGSLDKMQQIGTLLSILSMLHSNEERKQLSSIDYKTSSWSHSNQHKVNETISFILEHLDQKLTVNRLAQQTSMVPQSFCRWFKKASGNSFVTFLNKARIEKACQLVLTTEMPIQQIAFDCGFDSLSHFNRTFKTTKGMSPRNFRNFVSEGHSSS